MTTLKHKLTNLIMRDGRKKTVEKILIKSLKLLQKNNKKNHKNLLKNSIVNSTPTFKMTKQAKKKGKRKMNQEVPAFIKSDSLRINSAINFLISSSLKNKNNSHFYKRITHEIIDSFSNKGNSLERKTDLQNQVLKQKRYLLNFRW